MATYVNDLRLTELATGEGSGTWGTTTNTSLELIGEAMGAGAEAIANASTHTITMADGATDGFRSLFLRLTGGGQACTVTLAPNTLSHVWIMRNETSATLTLTQGSGANVAIAAGQTKIVATDGAGSGAIVYEMDDLELAGNLLVGGTLGVTGVLTATSLDISGDIDVDGTTNLDVVDIDGAVDMASTLQVDGAITSSAGATITVADNSDTLTLVSTDADANTGPVLNLFRNSASPADNDAIGKIVFKGDDDGGNEATFALIQATATDVSNGSENAKLEFTVAVNDSFSPSLTLQDTGDVEANRARSNTVGEVALSVQPSDSVIHYGFRIDSSTNSLNLDRADSGNEVQLLSIDTSGGVILDRSDNGDNLTLRTSDADASAGPNLKMYRNSASPADNDFLGNIKFVGRNDNSQDVQYAEQEVYILDASDGTEDGLYNVNVITAGTNLSYMQFKAGSGVVFNEDSNDIDFRVESNAHTNMFFIDGGNDGIGIGNSTIIDWSTNYPGLQMGQAGALYGHKSSNQMNFAMNWGVTTGNVYIADGIASRMIMDTSKISFDSSASGSAGGAITGINILQMTTSGSVFNEDSGDQDFRVESNGNTHMLFVDGGNNKVGIGVSSIDAECDALHITSSGTNTVLIDGTGGEEMYSYHDSDGCGWATGADGSYGELLYLNEQSSRIDLYAAGGQVAQFGAGVIVLNESGNDQDFRVESDGLANALFVEASTNRVAIGTGTTDTGTILTVAGAATFTGQNTAHGASRLKIGQDQSTISQIRFYGADTSTAGVLQFTGSSSDGSVGGERMRITSAGRVVINDTAAAQDAMFSIKVPNSVSANAIVIKPTSNATINAMLFENSSGTNVGFIQYNASSTTYSTSSDYRLKENVVALSGATDRLKQLNPSRFNFIADADTTVDGFLAHEVQAVVPEAVTGTKDAVDADGNPEYQGIDQSKLVPLLVATIQELEARIAALESE